MLEADAREPVESPPPRPEEMSRPLAPADPDAERVQIVGDDGLVDEPSDDDRPRFDDDLDPSDAP
jgi:hypothetical protein